MTTATVTTMETVKNTETQNQMDRWEVQERTQTRAEYEYDRAVYDVKILDGDYKTVYLLGHILGKSIAEIKEDLSHVEA